MHQFVFLAKQMQTNALEHSFVKHVLSVYPPRSQAYLTSFGLIMAENHPHERRDYTNLAIKYYNERWDSHYSICKHFLSMIHEKELQKEKRGTAGNKGENKTEESAVSPVEEMTQREVVPNLKVHWS